MLRVLDGDDLDVDALLRVRDLVAGLLAVLACRATLWDSANPVVVVLMNTAVLTGLPASLLRGEREVLVALVPPEKH